MDTQEETYLFYDVGDFLDYWEDDWFEMVRRKDESYINSFIETDDKFYEDADFDDLENILDENGEIGWGEMSYRRYPKFSGWDLL